MLLHTCLRNLGLTWMLAFTVAGSGLMGHAGSTALTRASRPNSFLRGNTSSQVERSLNKLFLVFSSTCNRGRHLVHGHNPEHRNTQAEQLV